MTLQEKVLEFEEDVSGEDFAKEVSHDIRELKTWEDVRRYYMEDRGWQGDEELTQTFVYFLVGYLK